MANLKKDLTGEKFGAWTVLYRVENKKFLNGSSRHRWLCRCICGTEKVVLGDSLKNGTSKSCGCTRKIDDVKRAIQMGKLNQKQNRWEYDEDLNCMIGYTTKGEPFYIDCEDFEKVKDFCWSFSRNYLVSSRSRRETGFYNLHNLIMGEKGVDHIKGFGSEHDNRKSNLRKCTQTENNCNQRLHGNNTSGVKGVYWDKRSKAWVARIQKKEEKYCKYFYAKKYNNDKDMALKEASEWIEQIRLSLHKEFANNGKRLEGEVL